MNSLHCFWAVTTKGSLYFVSVKPMQFDWPTVVRIRKDFYRGRTSLLSDKWLGGGSNVAISPEGLMVYQPANRPTVGFADEVSRIDKGPTSRVAALFLTEKAGNKCLDEANFGQIHPLDGRWLDHTRETLNAIGYDHPTFKLSKQPEMAFPPHMWKDMRVKVVLPRKVTANRS